MKNLENYGVEEMSASSSKLVNGGTWLGYVVGFVLGGSFRYSGAYGAAKVSSDMAVYFAKK